jgi:cytochrome c1
MRPALAACLVVLGACGGEAAPPQDRVLGGQRIAGAVLQEGEFHYMRYCRGCHGVRGEGDGRYAPTLAVPPRNLTLGEYPHLGATEGQLPTDDDLLRLVREGIEGSPMNGIPELTDREANALVQYLKTLSPRWSEG